MGTTSTKNKKQPLISHQKFESVKIINNDEMQIQTRTTLDDYNTWKTNLKKINSFNKQNILIPLNHSFQKEGWCSENTGIVNIIYDNYQFIFEEELQNRITLNKHLSEQQMWYLLYTLVSTAKDFSFLNKKVGDIRPHNIFVSEAGQIKIGVCFSWPNQLTNYQKTSQEKQITYLSPQQLQLCKNNKMDNLINAILSESFSIGLTMLHAGLLFNFSSIYNIEKFQINSKLLEQKINDWLRLQFINEQDVKVSYSTALKEIIKNMCMIDTTKRQSSIDIYQLLQPYKDQILNIEPFELKYGSKQIISVNDFKTNQNQQSFENNAKNNSDFPLYNYVSYGQNIPQNNNNNSAKTQYSFTASNLDWPRGNITPLPVKVNVDNSQGHYQIFNRYSSSSNNIIIPNQQHHVSFTNNNFSNIKQNYQIKTQFHTPAQLTQLINTNGVNVKPFQMKSDNLMGKYSYPVQKANQKEMIQKKIVVTHSPTYTSTPIKQVTTTSVQNVEIKRVGSTQDYSQFLRKIDQQIQRSRSLFPS